MKLWIGMLFAANKMRGLIDGPAFCDKNGFVLSLQQSLDRRMHNALIQISDLDKSVFRQIFILLNPFDLVIALFGHCDRRRQPKIPTWQSPLFTLMWSIDGPKWREQERNRQVCL
jgi:hypothetical protein